MQETRLIELLKTFSVKEFTRYDEFVRSPYHNKNERLIKFCGWLQKRHPAFNAKDLTKEQAFSLLVGEEDYSDQKIRDLISEMYRLARQFLAHEHISRNHLEWESITAKTLGERELFRQVSSILKRVEKDLEKNKLNEENYFFLRSRIDSLWLTYHDHVNTANEYKVLENSVFPRATESATKFYLSNILLNYICLLNLKNIYGIEFDEKFFEYLLFHLKDSIRSDEVLRAFELIMSMIRDDDATSFNELWQLTRENLDAIPIHLRAEIFTNLENFCLKKARDGQFDYLEKAYQLYKEEVEIGTAYERGNLNPVVFRNIVFFGLNFGDIEFVDGFVQEYGPKLAKQSRANGIAYARSLVLFEKGEFDRCLEEMQLVKTDTYFTQIDMKQIQLMVYYEKGDPVLMDSQIDSMRHMLNNKELIYGTRRKNMANFVDFVSQIFRVKVDPDKKELDKFLTRYNALDSILYRRWFDAKIAELTPQIHT